MPRRAPVPCGHALRNRPGQQAAAGTRVPTHGGGVLDGGTAGPRRWLYHKREREGERERESGGQPHGDGQRTCSGQRASVRTRLPTHGGGALDGGTAGPRRWLHQQERERERERLGGELRMADHSVLYFFFFVKKFYPFVNTPPHLELFPAPRRIRPPHSPGEPLTAKYPRLRASPRLRWLFFGVACPSSASARQENFFSRASNALKEKTGCRFVHAKGIPLSMIL